MDYQPTPAVLKWVKQCVDTCGSTGEDTEYRRKKLRRTNAKYLKGLKLAEPARSQAAMTIRNLLA